MEDGLIVHLEPYSGNQLDVFRTIEEPETPLKFPSHLAAIEDPPETIGRFYRAIRTQLATLPDMEFANPARNQVGSGLIGNSTVVTDARIATAAIDLIVEQGEGTSQSPSEVVGTDVAHFYRFTQIAKGNRLIKNSQAGPSTPVDQQYVYGGAPILFDQSGVASAPRDPKASNYQPGTDARKRMDTFNALYTDLLKSLQLGFNGSVVQLNSAIHDKMPALGAAARKLMATPAPGGGTLGPSFEYFVDG